MELGCQPRTDPVNVPGIRGAVSPDAVVHSYTDFLGNMVHQFNIPSMHQELNIRDSLAVERLNVASPVKSELIGWGISTPCRRSAHGTGTPQPFCRATDRLRSLAEQLRITRRDDPLTVLRDLNSELHRTLNTNPRAPGLILRSTNVWRSSGGVCQTLPTSHRHRRLLRIPCRYVSGYLFHRPDHHSGGHGDASHAWAEALLPQLGWVGFDPANNCLSEDDHRPSGRRTGLF